MPNYTAWPQQRHERVRCVRRQRWWRLLVCIVVLASLGACVKISKNAKRRGTPSVIWGVSFVGNKALNESQLLEAMEQVATSRSVRLLRVGQYQLFKSPVFQADMRRLRQLYRFHGYYNPVVSLVRVLPLVDKASYREFRRVRIVLRIEEGPPVIVQFVKVDWARKIPGHKEITQYPWFLQKKAQFSTPAYRKMKQQLMNTLQQQSYARAKVRGRVIIDKLSNQAQIQLRILPGPTCYFGGYVIKGNKEIPTTLLRNFVSFKKGQKYNVSALAKTQNALFGLNVFSSVNLKPNLKGKPKSQSRKSKNPKDERLVSRANAQKNEQEVPIVIEVTEDKFQLWRFGAGYVIDGQRHQIQGSFGLTVLNFLGGLRSLEFQVLPGWAFLPDIVRRYDSGPELTASLSFTQPIFLKRRSELGARILYRRTEEIGETEYQLILTSLWYSVPLLDKLTLRLGFNLEIAVGVQDPLTLLQESYLLSFFEQQLVLDLRDNPLRTTRGIYAMLTLQEADGVLGEFRYLRALAEFRFFAPLFSLVGRKTVLAGRVAYGIMFSSRPGEEPTDLSQITNPEARAEARVRQILRRSPLTQRFFSGGANSVRGWTQRFLGPLACQLRQQRIRTNFQRERDTQGRNVSRALPQTIPVGQVVPGAGRQGSGTRCQRAAAEVMRSRNRDLAQRRTNLPAGQFAGIFTFPGQDVLQVVPMGGEHLIEANLELRLPVLSWLGLVFFTDLGLVQLEPRLFEGESIAWDLVPSVVMGSGLRLSTPIGAIRLDLAFHLLANEERYPLQRNWEIHFSIGEAF